MNWAWNDLPLVCVVYFCFRVLYFLRKPDVLSLYDPGNLSLQEALSLHAQRHRLFSLPARLKRHETLTTAASPSSGTRTAWTRFELFSGVGCKLVDLQPWSRQKVEPSTRAETHSCKSSNLPRLRKLRWVIRRTGFLFTFRIIHIKLGVKVDFVKADGSFSRTFPQPRDSLRARHLEVNCITFAVYNARHECI